MKKEIVEKENEIKAREEVLKNIPDFTELLKMGSGKSFGEKALISESVRAATIVCTKNCYFAVMLKADYEKVLKKIELKSQHKMITFLKCIPYIRNWTDRSLINFSYYL